MAILCPAMPQNIDDFNACVVRILGKLYENFPKGIELNANELATLDAYSEGPIQREEIDRHNDLYETYYYTARFLLAEGYISGGMINGYTYVKESVLTVKGLAALQRVPESIQGKKGSVGDFFIELGKEGLKAATKEALSSAVRTVFNG